MKSTSQSFDHLTEELRRRHAMRAGAAGASEHLSEDTLQALADGSLGVLETATVRAHIAQCLDCLNAYAEVRALWETSETPTDSRCRRAAQMLREAIRAPMPA